LEQGKRAPIQNAHLRIFFKKTLCARFGLARSKLKLIRPGLIRSKPIGLVPI